MKFLKVFVLGLTLTACGSDEETSSPASTPPPVVVGIVHANLESLELSEPLNISCYGQTYALGVVSVVERVAGGVKVGEGLWTTDSGLVSDLFGVEWKVGQARLFLDGQSMVITAWCEDIKPNNGSLEIDSSML